MDSDEPRWKKSSTAKDEPRRATLRSDIEEPTWMKSSTDSDDPNRA
jgi:hypothetical protein